MKKFFTPVLLLVTLTSCNLAPTYHRPAMPIPYHFKEMGKWKEVKSIPCPAKLSPWWQAFQDQTLNGLEEQLTLANQDLKVAFAHYQEAAALAQVARSNLLPTIQAFANANREKTSTTVANPNTMPLFNQFLLGGDISYEVDAWGSVRNAVLASNKLATASAADVAAVRISLHAELATDYFALRASDESQRILDATVVAYQKALYLTKKRYQGGASPIADVYEAETQLENAKTLATDTRLKRAQLEHAIAVLVGEIPANFSLAAGMMPGTFIKVTPNLPSTLLERRPDIAAAELRVQAANANIGVARAAFFPDFNLTSIIAFESQTLSNLISKPSLFWSLGPITLLTITQPIAQVTVFDGGRLRGLLNKAKAEYFETVAAYRQTVLASFQEVEDNLVAIQRLDEEHRSQLAATYAAKRSWVQEQDRYAGGLVTFLQVVIVENLALQAELALVNVSLRRQVASVQLVKALGGGWTMEDGLNN